MADFKFLQNPVSKKWVISAPRRAKRPDEASGTQAQCPFCPGVEAREEELYRVGGEIGDSSWNVLVIPNKYPFAPIHEVIIHSPQHDKNFDSLSLSQTKLVIETYKQRFSLHKDKGQVYIFQNHGEKAGESLSHPHSQLVVIPPNVGLNILPIEAKEPENSLKTPEFVIFCPLTSEWPDEVWVRPLRRGKMFYEINEAETEDLSKILHRLIQILDVRHGSDFPFNLYIYPSGDWYLRIIPRVRMLGGFEVGTGVSVNTQDPSQSLEFIKTHFEAPDTTKIQKEHKADYSKTV